MTEFTLTARQTEAQAMLRGPAMHQLLEGGSRSGKTLLLLRAIATRAIKAPASRHAVLRFRFNHVKASIVRDTWPKMMALCFPQVKAPVDKVDWFSEFPNRSQVWFGGLDDKDRLEKILGNEYVTIFLNECSQISWAARNIATTRLAQKVWMDKFTGVLPLRMYYDCNPPKKSHWTYVLFHRLMQPGTIQSLETPSDFSHMRINPSDNRENLPLDYIEKNLAGLPERQRRRFLLGEYGEAAPGALWREEDLGKWRHTSGALPDMQRIVVAVDPSGTGDDDTETHDEIGIVVCGLGVDGNGYLLEDLSLHGGPATWGRVVANAYERHNADLVVAETNFGGAMVEFVVKAAKADIPFKQVTASRGKVVRAEPIASLAEQGRIRHVGRFDILESELLEFTDTGYMGVSSPNRADAHVWGFSELFPGIAQGRREAKPIRFAGWYG